MPQEVRRPDKIRDDFDPRVTKLMETWSYLNSGVNVKFETVISMIWGNKLLPADLKFIFDAVILQDNIKVKSLQGTE